MIFMTANLLLEFNVYNHCVLQYISDNLHAILCFTYICLDYGHDLYYCIHNTMLTVGLMGMQV